MRFLARLVNLTGVLITPVILTIKGELIHVFNRLHKK